MVGVTEVGLGYRRWAGWGQGGGVAEPAWGNRNPKGTVVTGGHDNKILSHSVLLFLQP